MDGLFFWRALYTIWLVRPQFLRAPVRPNMPKSAPGSAKTERCSAAYLEVPNRRLPPLSLAQQTFMPPPN